MIKVLTPPDPTNILPGKIRLFLAGSIEMGSAENWQSYTIDKIKKLVTATDISIFNPRRPDWDNSWEQSFKNPYFFQQVNWELNNLDWATDILFYFDPNTKSPITLMELGEVNKNKRIRVVCPDGFWRKGNVDVYCSRYNIPQFPTLDSAILDIVNSTVK